jgi:glutathione peroxidase
MTSALQTIALDEIDGGTSRLGDYRGKVLLVVNVASKCGLTPQYEGLETLYRRYRDQGLVVLGFPANDFRGQEPGSDAEIAEFCKLTYDVDFPMFSKIKVTGPDKHPLYAALISAHPDVTSTTGGAMRDRLKSHGIEPNPEPELLWNFEKFLIGRDGEVVGRFSPDTGPGDPALVGAIEAALAS